MSSARLPVAYDPFSGTGPLALVHPTTEAQKEVFTSAHWGRDASCAYNESFSLRFRGALDVERLRSALATVTSRHEALRAAVTPDGMSACVAETLIQSLASDDLSAQSSADRGAAVARAQDEEAEREFDLVCGPLFRVRLLRLAADEHHFIFCAHHLVCDGWSIAVVVKELAAIYGGRGDELEPAIPYSDYARRERERLASGGGAEDEAFWLSVFRGGAPALDLPLDQARPPVRPYHSRRVDLDLPPELIKRLKAFGAKNGSSFFTVLIAGYYALLNRWSGAEEIVVGVPAAGQSIEGEATLVGHCVNLLPILAQPTAGKSFAAFLKEVRAVVLDAFDHQQFTYGSLLTKLSVERDPSRLPLVSVIFNLDQGLFESAYAFEGLETAFTTTPRRFENFELFFNVIEIGGKTTIECQYLEGLFDEKTITSRLESYVRLLESAVAAPETLLGKLPMAPVREEALFAQWNRAAMAPAPKAQTIHGLIGAQARATPDRIAVRCGERQLTYRELWDDAGRVAQRLRAMGVKPGVMVGISVERSLAMLSALIGIMRAGGAYVPLDPTLPKDRLKFMLEDTEASVLILTDETMDVVPEAFAAKMIHLDRERETLKMLSPLAEEPEAQGAAAGPEDIAYVIFTSGSTGRPKGVLCPHRGVASLLDSMTRWPGLGLHDKQLGVTTISFDVHVPDLYLPLVVGAELVIATKDDTLEGERLKDLLDRRKITFMQATPATWRMLLAVGWRGGQHLKIVSTGEPLPRELAAELLPLVGELWNMYGPTETTIYSTGCRIEDAGKPILIGKPVANTTLFVVNDVGEACPIGVPGELLIGGVGVTRGYLKREDLTAEKFVSGPGGARVYKTGDLARFLPSGDVECLGRNDHQVKVRGFRIELGEIEAELAKVPSVRAAVVGVRDRVAGDRRLVAWIVSAGNAAPEAMALKEALRAFLPEYMVPQHFLSIDLLPLTPTGKVDRKKLPSPFGAGGRETVPVPGTGAKLARRAPQTPMELSVTQRRVLDLEQSMPGLALYNLPTGFRIFGPFQIEAASRALDQFVNRHEALRTAFRRTADAAEPVVSPSVSFRPEMVDLTSSAREAQEARMSRDFHDTAHRPFDLTRAPLFRATIYKIAEQEHVLFIMAHQATWDGWSFDIFVREMSSLYEAAANGGVATLLPLELGFGDYALWHNRALRGSVMKEQLAYWRAKLENPPSPLAMPTTRARPARFTFKGHSVSFFMARDLANALTTVGREVGATFFHVLLSAYKILLSRRTGASELVVGTPVRGREGREVESIVGPFLNYIAVRSKVEASEPFTDFLRKVRLAALEGMGHDALPFDHLVQELGLDRDLARTPLFQAIFSFQDARARNTTFGKLPFKQVNIEPLTVPAELNFWVKESNENLMGSMNYASDLFDEESMRDFLECYDALLRAIVAEPRLATGKLAVTPAEAEASEGCRQVGAWLTGIPEIESTLGGLEAIKEAAVALQYDETGTPRLAAYFSLAAGEFVTASDLRRHVRLKHGEALVPHAFIEVETMPRLTIEGASGKIDKSKLPPAYRRLDVAGGGELGGQVDGGRPRTKAELALALIWKEMLGVDEVSTRGNFFELGGHSLLAIQMIGRVERELGVKLPRMAVTLNTLGQIAKTLGMDEATAVAPPAAAVVATPAKAAPATSAPPAKGIGKLWSKLRGG